MSAQPSPLHPRPLIDLVAESPLVPVALAATIGLMADRYAPLPLAIVAVVGLAGLVGWMRWPSHPQVSRLSAWIATAALAALYHHGWQHLYAADDIGQFASSEPKLVRVRGILDEEPTVLRRPRGDPLATYLRPDPTRVLLNVFEYQTDEGDWSAASGRARLNVEGPLLDYHLGDVVEVVGWLQSPRGPQNPGGPDSAQRLRDRRVRAELFVRRTPAAVQRLAQGHGEPVRAWLAAVRGWGRRVIERELPREHIPIATALLLGDTSYMSTPDWDRFVRTGVIHVLAISGQHLTVLAAVLSAVLVPTRLPRRSRTILVAVVLIGYALLTGFRPPVQRATVIAVVGAVAVILRRLPLPANTFALAWLGVVILDPTEPFSLGCQLSFLSVAVLGWGVSRVLDPGELDPMEQLVERSRTRTERSVRAALRWIGRMYLTSILIGVAIMPMVAARQHVVSISGVLIGPPVIVLSSIALVAGFAMLIVAPVGLADPFALVARLSLTGCDQLITWAERLPGGSFFVPVIPEWWLWGWYLALLILLWCPACWSRRRWFAIGFVAWALFGLFAAEIRTENELRVTFLAVGHGGCTVIECPDGRVLVYDAGAMSGSEVARRHIAPFLWSRGYRRIDELFLSHADLDHFNGTADLLAFFTVGQATVTPTFAEKDAPGVRRTLSELETNGVPIRIVYSGMRLDAGRVEIEVLHPPPRGPGGEENVRSMVLRLRHGLHTILLTGDLQSPGLERVIAGLSTGNDVLMAPHHGSPTSNNERLVRWANPRLAVSSDSQPRPPRRDDPYAARGIPHWVTGVDGAITIRSSAQGLHAESYVTGRFLTLTESPAFSEITVE